MFLFVASALAGSTLIGWPCQRLNWGWRNVWSTCSINSYTPVASGTETFSTTIGSVPTGFRFNSATPNTPFVSLANGGWFAPTAANVNTPNFLCTSAANTGSGYTATLRNRCRRAIDAYGALVKTCIAVPSPNNNRGPNTLLPDWAPNGGHAPHVTNVQGLTINAQLCQLPAGQRLPADMATPQNTCPGLLGWFTVVFNACGFTNAPSLVPTNVAAFGPQFYPIGAADTFSTATYAPAANAMGVFCTTGAISATSWNVKGTAFTTTRCRKALDQFGRTASRCHMSAVGVPPIQQAGGWTDPLRLLAVGNVPAQSPTSPQGMNVWAPVCNS
jgi:hypothetical protein